MDCSTCVYLLPFLFFSFLCPFFVVVAAISVHFCFFLRYLVSLFFFSFLSFVVLPLIVLVVLYTSLLIYFFVASYCFQIIFQNLKLCWCARQKKVAKIFEFQIWNNCTSWKVIASCFKICCTLIFTPNKHSHVRSHFISHETMDNTYKERHFH